MTENSRTAVLVILLAVAVGALFLLAELVRAILERR